MSCWKGIVGAPWLTALTTAIGLTLSLPMARQHIEQSMLVHMVVQMPLLVWSGARLMQYVQHHRILGLLVRWNAHGLTGFFLGVAVLTYWMLPSALDSAVVNAKVDALKITSLMLAGAALPHAFWLSTTTVQLFFVSTTVPMMVWLGMHFATTEQRLCNAYSLETQVHTGYGLMLLALLLATVWLAHVAKRLYAPRPGNLALPHTLATSPLNRAAIRKHPAAAVSDKACVR